MITVSLCMIVKNEEQNIQRCLNSVLGVVDEIIIVDTGSTDKTKELCFKYTEKVYDFAWINDFSAARNYAYSFATMDYILWLDADDIIMIDDRSNFIELKNTLDTKIDVIMMKYNTGIDIRGNVVFSYYRERLTKRERNYKWMEPVHEYIETFGNVINSDIGITHGKIMGKEHNTRNIKIYENIIKKKIPLTPRGNFYYARELKDHGKFSDSAKQFEKFLDSNSGWREDNISACSELAKCYLKLGDGNKALGAMYRSFIYDIPRAEACCQIGYYFQEKGDYKRAVFWFEFILTLKKPDNVWGFLQHDCWDFIPYLECAVCYDKLGEKEKAEEYNTKALQFKPHSTQALLNQKYFNQINV